MKKISKLLIILITIVFLLSGCNKSPIKKPDNNNIINNFTTEDPYAFIENFPDNYPGFELLDSIVATEESSPIKVVIIAHNKEKNTASTLFFLFDNGGTGYVSFDEDIHAYYRPEDGFRLEKNVVYFSLNVEVAYSEYEIRDFKITVEKIDNPGTYGITYISDEIIRENKGQ